MRAAGFTPDSVTIAGGATRSELWLQTHADVSNVPFILTKASQGLQGGMAWGGMLVQERESRLGTAQSEARCLAYVLSALHCTRH